MEQRNAFYEDVHDMNVDAMTILRSFDVFYECVVIFFYLKTLIPKLD